MATLGRKLASSRVEAGYHYPKDIAAALGVSDQTVRNWESGRHAPGVAELARWAQIVGKPVAYFLEATQADAPAVAAVYHPGLEELAANEALRRQYHVTDEELDAARDIIPSGRAPIATLESALRAIELVRSLGGQPLTPVAQQPDSGASPPR